MIRVFICSRRVDFAYTDLTCTSKNVAGSSASSWLYFCGASRSTVGVLSPSMERSRLPCNTPRTLLGFIWTSLLYAVRFRYIHFVRYAYLWCMCSLRPRANRNHQHMYAKRGYPLCVPLPCFVWCSSELTTKLSCARMAWRGQRTSTRLWTSLVSLYSLPLKRHPTPLAPRRREKRTAVHLRYLVSYFNTYHPVRFYLKWFHCPSPLPPEFLQSV